MRTQTAKVTEWTSDEPGRWTGDQLEFQRVAQTVMFICQHLGVKCVMDLHMKDLTSIGVGGPVVAVVFPKNARSALQLIQRLGEEDIRWSPLGMGTNILAFDHAHYRVAVSLREFFGSPSIEGPVVQVPAGLSVPALIHAAAELGLSGLEGLSGLSGSVGGAVKRNASAYGHEFGTVTRSLTLLSNEGIRTLSAEDIGFSPGGSRIRDDELILTAAFQLARGDRAGITRTIARYRKAQLEHRPLNERCLGGVFKNPPNQSAGRIIDELGLKGLSRGGAVVSDKHANYIVNQRQASAADILELIEDVRRAVFSVRRIDLQPGITVWVEEGGE